jgi:secreted trypsin-like serine protease
MRVYRFLVALLVLLLMGGAASAQEAKGWLGADVVDVTKAEADKLKWDAPHGAKIGVVATGSPADKAGLKAGDIIVAVDGVEAETSADFKKAFAAKPPGAEVRLRVFSAGRERRISVTLAERPRIVGGDPTDTMQHPWQVALAIGDTLCGGSIIAPGWMLTAAHCVLPPPKLEEVKVKANATDYTHSGIWTEIERIVVHEQYDPSTNEHDLALVELKVPTAGSVIVLASASLTVPDGQLLEVTGWGVTAEIATIPSAKLRKAQVPYVDNANCNSATAYNGRIKPGMMCAGNREGGIDACQGDSGGPLVWRTAEGPILVGVVSFGDGCARKLKYGVYTRVSAYRDWIDRTLASDRH